MTEDENKKIQRLMQYAQMGDNPAPVTAGFGTFPFSPSPMPPSNLESAALPDPEVSDGNS